MQPVNTVSYLLQHIAAVLHRQSDQVLLERLGIGMSQFRILVMLQASPGISQRKLGDSLGQTEASISRQIKLLQEKGLCASRTDPAERRKHLAAPTTKGLKITEAAREVLASYHAPMLDPLTDKQRRALQETLHHLHDYSCAPGRPGGCDHPFDLLDLYNAQTASGTKS